jgi:hypothetical protein
MPRGGKRTPREGKKLGRPEKPKIVQFANKGIASTVLDMDGPPHHARKCKCPLCKKNPHCSCKTLDGVKFPCEECSTRANHATCRCEVCGWWALLTATDRRLVFESRRYLTDRRDGKPAQGVFVGDTREKMRELDFGDLPELITPGKSLASRRPN